MTRDCISVGCSSDLSFRVKKEHKKFANFAIFQPGTIWNLLAESTRHKIWTFSDFIFFGSMYLDVFKKIENIFFDSCHVYHKPPTKHGKTWFTKTRFHRFYLGFSDYLMNFASRNIVFACCELHCSLNWQKYHKNTKKTWFLPTWAVLSNISWN